MVLARCRRISCSLNEDEINKGRKKKNKEITGSDGICPHNNTEYIIAFSNDCFELPKNVLENLLCSLAA